MPPLAWSENVARVARLHSENMANFQFFGHEGLNGMMVNDRADSIGVTKWRAVGENIAYNRGYDNPVAFAVERWKESGIGLAITENGTYYFTQVFLQRK